jgi:proteasome accessory factor C
MSDKFNAMLHILAKLNAGLTVTTQVLTEELGVCPRSIRRYIRSLNTAGFPIIHIDGKYQFEEGYRLQKLALSDEETLSLALSRQLLASMGGKLTKGIDRIEERLLKRGSAQSVTILNTDPQIPKDLAVPFQEIHHAILARTVIQVCYRSSSDGSESMRIIEPLYLFCRESAWYLRAWCRNDEANRTFALDCILNITIMPNERFYCPPVDPEEELSGGFGTYLDGPPTKVVLRFDKTVVSRVARRKWHQSQEEQYGDDGSILLTFTVNGTLGIKRWLYQWIPDVEVLKPEALRLHVVKEVCKMSARHTAQK